MKVFRVLKKNILYVVAILLFFLIIFMLCCRFMYLENFDIREPTPEIVYYVITLNKEDRLKNIENQQNKIKQPFKLFTGVDGKTVKIDEIRDPKIDSAFMPEMNDERQIRIRKNEIGVYLSHYTIYNEIKKDGNENGYTVIFEDDFNLIDDFESVFQSKFQQFKEMDFDIMFLENVANNIGETTTTDGICQIDKNKSLYGTLAYVVRNSSIDKIIQETKNMQTQIDHQLGKGIFNGKLKVFTFCPFIVKQGGFESTIQVS